MSRVGTESVRLHGLVNAMLELARGGERRDQVVVALDMVEVARAVVDDLRAAYPKRRIGLELDGSATHVAGDPARIHQALLNLGANACAHTEPGAPIAVSVRSQINC